MSKSHSKYLKWDFYSEYDSVNKSLPIYRVIFAVFGFVVLLPKYLWISSYPDTFFFPPIGFTLFFTGFPDIYFFYILNFFLVVAFLSLLVGYKSSYASIAIALLLLVGNSWRYSFGKISHDILLIIIPLVLSISFWDKKVSGNKDSINSYSWAVPLFALLLSLAMLSAAIPKILSGWLDPSSSALTGHLVRNYFVTERQTLLGYYLLSHYNFYIFKFLEYNTLIIESAFVFSVFSLRYFRLTCAIACLFHFGVQLTMGISFVSNIIAYGVFVNWSYILKFETFQNWLSKLDEISEKVGILKLTIAAIPIWLLYMYLGHPITLDLNLTTILGGNVIETTIMSIAVVISVLYIYNFFMDLIRKRANGFRTLENNI